MNESIAVDPGLKLSPNELRNLFSKFGIENSRYIGDITNDWLRTVQSTFTELSELERARCVELLRRNKDCIRQLGIGSRDRKWVDNALTARNKKQVDEVISGQEFENVIHYENFIFDDDKFPPQRQTHVIPAKIEDYLKVFIPLIEMSRELILADRYFNLNWYRSNSKRPNRENKKIEFLVRLIERMENDSVERRLVILFERNKTLAYDEQAEDILVELKNIEREIDPNFVTIDHYIVEKLKHWRYFFSIKGGVKLDQGVHLKNGSTSEITYLNAKNIEHVFKDYEGIF